jgi:hypothetical protein
MTFGITTFSINGLFVTRSINDIHHKSYSAKQHCIECHYAEYRNLFVMSNVVMLSVVMLSVVMRIIVMLNVIMLSVVMLNVVAPCITTGDQES